MNAEHPYADAEARLHLLYRLPWPEAGQRMLVVGTPAAMGLPPSAALTPKDAVNFCASGRDLPDGEALFDVVALPWELGRHHQPAQLLAAVHRLLVPGGTVVGHLTHRLAWRQLTHPSQWADALRGRFGPGTAKGCQRALSRAGFFGVECYFVQPNIDNPMGLIPCEAQASRNWFLRSVRATFGQRGPLSYGARFMLAFLGLGGLQQSELFFWARRPC